MVIGTEQLEPEMGCIVGKNATYLGGVTNTASPTVNNGVWVRLKNGSTWRPKGTNYLTRLEVSDDSAIVGNVTVNGEAITPRETRFILAKLL